MAGRFGTFKLQTLLVSEGQISVCSLADCPAPFLQSSGHSGVPRPHVGKCANCSSGREATPRFYLIRFTFVTRSPALYFRRYANPGLHCFFLLTLSTAVGTVPAGSEINMCKLQCVDDLPEDNFVDVR